MYSFNNFRTCSKFFSKHYEHVLKLLNEYIPTEDQSFNFRAGKRGYFLAATYFMLQDFQSAARLINLINPIDADKDGWGLGIKILQIVNAIELNEFDEA